MGVKNPVHKGLCIALILIAATFFLARQTRASSGSLPSTATAPTTPATSDTQDVQDEEEKQKLLKVIDTTTEIATKTRLNADYVPGIVTILEGEDLERRGIATVGEALELVPGIHLTYVTSGVSPQAVVRGIGQVFTSGKFKTMVNGLPWNAAGSDLFDPYFIPVELVSRIEVIRGPGSVLYGNNAYSGLLNIITRENSNRLFLRYGSHDALSTGGTATYTNNPKDLKITLNLGATKRNWTGREVDKDILYGTRYEPVSQAPGTINDAYKTILSVLSLGYKDFYLQTQASSVRSGSNFGLTGALPPLEGSLKNARSSFFTEAGWTPKISEDLSLSTRLRFKQYLWRLSDFYFYPPGFAGLKKGAIVTVNSRENSIDGAAEIQYTGLDKHKFVAGLEYEFIKGFNVWRDMNYESMTFKPLPWMVHMTGDMNWADDYMERSIWSTFIQDQYSLADSLTLTGGVRYDFYSDTGNRFTPRISAVYQLAESHLLKAQYASAFRPPTFLEMYAKNNIVANGNKNMSAETIDTYEIGYIYKRFPLTGKVTLFHSELRDLIVVAGNAMYTNLSSASTKGVEAEFGWEGAHWLAMDGNISYISTKDNATGGEIPGSAKWLGNLALTVKPWQHWAFVVQSHYVGKRNRQYNDDPREPLRGYCTVDATINADNLIMQRFTLRGGIKNIFNADVRYPSFYPGFTDDYPLNGRTGWVQLSYAF